MALVAQASASSYATAQASLFLFITSPVPAGRHHRPSLQRRRGILNGNGCVIERRSRKVPPNAGPPATGLLLHSMADASDTGAAPTEQSCSPNEPLGFFRPQEEGRAASGGEQEDVAVEGSGRVDCHCSSSGPSISTVPRAEIVQTEVLLEQREAVKLPIDLRGGEGGGGGGGVYEGERISTSQRTGINGTRRQKPRPQEKTAWSVVPVSTSPRERKQATTTRQRDRLLDRVSQSSPHPGVERSQHPTHQHHRQQRLSGTKQQHGRRSPSSSPLRPETRPAAAREFSGTTEEIAEQDGSHDATSAFVTGGRSVEVDGEDNLERGAADFADVEVGPVAESYERGRWLLGLLALQSTSSFVLDKYQDLLREHVVVTLFLTMLVGAGGNAGNQSAIKVIRGLATGTYTADAACALRVVRDQAMVGFVLGTALSAGGFVRVWVTEGTTIRDASAISTSLFLIVMTSVLLGSALPFGLAKAGVDPAHAGTSIQVAMDIVGVAVTCVTCSFVLTQVDHVLSLAVPL